MKRSETSRSELQPVLGMVTLESSFDLPLRHCLGVELRLSMLPPLGLGPRVRQMRSEAHPAELAYSDPTTGFGLLT